MEQRKNFGDGAAFAPPAVVLYHELEGDASDLVAAGDDPRLLDRVEEFVQGLRKRSRTIGDNSA